MVLICYSVHSTDSTSVVLLPRARQIPVRCCSGGDTHCVGFACMPGNKMDGLSDSLSDDGCFCHPIPDALRSMPNLTNRYSETGRRPEPLQLREEVVKLRKSKLENITLVIPRQGGGFLPMSCKPEMRIRGHLRLHICGRGFKLKFLQDLRTGRKR